nr:HEAT repeat-containing protein 5B isoform X2 [Ipomoea batatas]
MAKSYARENVPLSRFGVLVAQLESIVASAAHKPPDPLLCFDLLSDLISAIDEEPKESILLCQRKCEDALYSLLVLGARKPVRHLASLAMARVIQKGDSISIYSRASSLQGFLSDGKKNEPHRFAGAAECLGELYRYFGRRITSGLLETTAILTKMLKFNEDFVRHEGFHMLQNALEGSGGSAASSAYTEAFRIIMRTGIGDKSFNVRIAAARCLKAFANIGGPGLGVGELESSSSYCVKALEDPIPSVRDAFAEALGALLALGMNPNAQVQLRGKAHFTPKKLEGGLERHLVLPFIKASGPRSKDLRVGLTLSWVSFLQAIRMKYLQPDSELDKFATQVIDMLRVDNSFDAQAVACVLYILRVGITDQMSEATQSGFLVVLSKQLQSPDATPSMRVAALRTLSYALKTLGEVPAEFKEVLDNTVVAAVSNQSPQVRVEAALTLRALAEVDPTCIGGLISYAVTMLSAVRENISFEKGTNLKAELDCLNGQAAVLAALVSVSPKSPLGYPARLPRSVLEVSKKMLLESSRNPTSAAVEKEAGWMLLSSLLSSMPKQELEEEVFDILSLWATVFSRNPERHISETVDLPSTLCVWSAAMDTFTVFIKCFLSSDAVSKGILLQPVQLYLSRALSYILQLVARDHRNAKPGVDVFIIKTLQAYQSLSDPNAYKSDHARIVHVCTTPFREASKCEESSCLRMLLDKRDAWLGPWNPGRDWFEDELRSFQGGRDGVLPCVWEHEPPSFPQPETISKSLVNQMLLSFGTMFASQDSKGMLSLLGTVEQSLKAGKKQAWHSANVTNICVGLLAGLKALHALRPEPLGLEVLNATQSIFQIILVEGDITASQRRALSEGLGLVARLGNDVFTAKLTRSFLGDIHSGADSHYAASIALALGCIHRSAGGMALSSLVPATVNSLSSLAKSSVTGLQIWSLHGLLLTIEAAGLSYVSHVQATLGLATDVLLSNEIGSTDLQQGVGRLINAIVAVLGPELAPGSIFFSRCKSVIAEISSRQETATLLENVRFTQQLVLFAPQAVSVHSHIQTLLPTLSSRQPTLRQLALSTVRHLIEKDPVSVINEQIENALFHMLDEETDAEIGRLARTTIMRLLYASCPSCPSHWLSICRNMILALSSRDAKTRDNMDSDSSGPGGETRLHFGGDEENMVSSSKSQSPQSYAFGYSSIYSKDKHLRYRTKVFAAECLSHIPEAVGKNPAHFDLDVAGGHRSGDWLVLHLQELISLAYQISTIQFENMRHIGVALLSTIMDKFETVSDPELPGHLLLEQYQAQLVSAIRTALDSSSGPVLLEAGLQLATKILTCKIVSHDQLAVKRIFSLISRPLSEFDDLYYPSFAEWVSCKIKIRLLTAHASLKCYTYTFLRNQHSGISDEYLALLPLFSESSKVLGIYWLGVLKDYSYVCFRSHPKESWKPFLDGIQSSLVSTKLLPCLEESWPLILQAVVLDAVPMNFVAKESSATYNESQSTFISGYSMVKLGLEDFQFLWGFSVLALFQGQGHSLGDYMMPMGSAESEIRDESSLDVNSVDSKLCDTLLPVFHALSTERFFSAGFLTVDICRELVQAFSFSICVKDAWDSLAISVLSQIVQHCPKEFLETENFPYLATELCLAFFFKFFLSDAKSQYHSDWENMISVTLTTAAVLLMRFEPKMRLKSLLAFTLVGYKCIGFATTDICLIRVKDFVQSITSSLQQYITATPDLGDDEVQSFTTTTRACLSASASLIKDCIESIHQSENKKSNMLKLLLMKLAMSLEQTITLAKVSFEIEHHRENEEYKPILYTTLCHSTHCIRTALCDSEIQVQVIGLQVLKGMLQRGVTTESTSFIIFFVGELMEDIIAVIHKSLKKVMNREAVAIIGECLKILMLLQTLSKHSDSQKGLMNLFLETILMIFTIPEDNSEEISDLRIMAVKLVSQLAQISTSAVYFKDVLLAMPITRRQQLQDIIRASVNQDQNPSQVKSTGPPLLVKLPAKMEETKDQNFTSAFPTKESEDNSMEEEEDDDDDFDDDWDTFQSFPASVNGDPPTSEIAVDSNLTTNTSVSNSDSGNNDLETQNSSKPLCMTEELNLQDETAAGENYEFATSSSDQIQEPHDCQDNLDHTEEPVTSEQKGTTELSQEGEHVSPIQPVVEVKEKDSESSQGTGLNIVSTSDSSLPESLHSTETLSDEESCRVGVDDRNGDKPAKELDDQHDKETDIKDRNIDKDSTDIHSSEDTEG